MGKISKYIFYIYNEMPSIEHRRSKAVAMRSTGADNSKWPAEANCGPTSQADYCKVSSKVQFCHLISSVNIKQSVWFLLLRNEYTVM